MRVIHSRHFWLILALFVSCSVFHYVERIGIIGTTGPSFHFGLTRHALGRILFLLPVIYSAYVFGLTGGLVTSFAALLVMLPRATLISPANGEPRFSTVLVCIGLEGVPEDVHVVSVSSQARKSRQKEFRVVEALQKNQNLLLTEENFSELLDRLVDKIIEGKLSLPISLQSILQIQESRQLRLCHQNKD